ncbi:helix-turn-helix domain-containing protein [Brucella anthropi]|uniref:helix-turn-helix domain-containing protein n=1 Tax=Brucella anthropi TaxID=529 RepID=UPI003987532C
MTGFPPLEAATGTDVPTVARRLFGTVRLHFPHGREGASRLVSAKFGQCRLTRLNAEAHRVDGTQVLTDGRRPDMVKLVIQPRGKSLFQQAGQNLTVGGQALVIYDPAYSYRLDNPMPVEVLMLQVPRGTLPPAIAGRLRRPMTVPLADGGLPNILFSMMQATILEMNHLDGAGRESLGRAMVDLTRTIVGDHMKADVQAQPLALLFDRIRDYVTENIRRSDLDAADIARRMGCSVRYVYRAFAAQGTTPADFIWEQRLAAAAEMLRNRPSRPGLIAETAFEFGFSSSAHFSRLFRQRYDHTPSQWREAAK